MEKDIPTSVDSLFIRIVKQHGLSVALMFLGLWFLNSRLLTAEQKIESLEAKLLDCYEKRISAGPGPVRPDKSQVYHPVRFFVVPDEIKLKRA